MAFFSKIMDLFLDYSPIFVELLFLIILLILIGLGISSYFKAKKLSEITVTLLIPSFVHIVSTLLTVFLLIFFLVGPEPRPLEKIPLGLKISGLIIFLIYCIVCWVLCTYVNRKLIKSLNDSGYESEKTQ